MSSTAQKDSHLARKLLLSTALVAVSVGYAWWQGGLVSQQQAAVMAAMQQPAPAQPQIQAQTPAPTAPQQTTPAQPQIQPQTAPAATPAAAPKPTTLALATPPTTAPAQTTAPATAPVSHELLPAAPAAPAAAPPPPGLTGMAAIRLFIPTEGVSPPLPPTMGTPDPGAAPPIPAGSHLEDGEYESDKVQFEWGDLRVKIFVTGGKITGVQIMSYPDHRSTSLYLIQLADPILNSEVIKTQQAEVNMVSSATNSSFAYQQAVANAITKATRSP